MKDDIDFSKMTDKQLMDTYYKFTSSKTYSMMMAGYCAGELINRGYDIIESGDRDKFVKKDKKVA